MRLLAVKPCTSRHLDDPSFSGDEGAAHRLARLRALHCRAVAQQLGAVRRERFGSVDVTGLPPTTPDELAKAGAELPIDDWMGTSGPDPDASAP